MVGGPVGGTIGGPVEGLQLWVSPCGSLVQCLLLRFIFYVKNANREIQELINIIFKDVKVRKSQKQFFLKLHCPKCFEGFLP